MIVHEEIVDTAAPPDEVYALLADVARTPEWLCRATKLEITDGAPLRVGSPLLYVYREGSGTKSMTGTVTELVPGKTTAFAYTDPMFDVAIRFDLTPHGGGTRVTHRIEIGTKALMAKLFTPLIRIGLRKQTPKDLAKLRDVAEKSA
jgi:uncharacterized protein YndB with AHSA1/START domain